jgi:hypothetical protein
MRPRERNSSSGTDMLHVRLKEFQTRGTAHERVLN